MDPISQGSVGALFSQTISRKEKLLPAAFVGLVAGLSPDLDILIRSSSDPILSLEYHRQFTHALIFIPIGAFIVTFFIQFFVQKYLIWKETYAIALIAYATHGLLDSCTTYGTQLFWPFSNYRVSFSNISIIDPLLTLPIILCILISILKKSKLATYTALLWLIFYLSFGYLQNQRVAAIAKNLAHSRNHQPIHLAVKPSFGNLFLWKSIYLHNDIYHIDAIRVIQELELCGSDKAKKFNFSTDLPSLDRNSQQAKDINRFKWFSDGYLSFEPNGKIVQDVRYSMLPSRSSPLWGIKIDEDLPVHAHSSWWSNRSSDNQQRKILLDLLLGKGCSKIEEL